MLQVAKILKPCGLKGEMKVIPYTDDAKFWKVVHDVYINGELFHVKHIRFYKEYLYITLNEITTAEQADNWRNFEIFADEELIHKKDFEYLISELVSCKVVGDGAELYGEIDSVEKYGAADIINIKKGGAIYSFPFLRELIVKIDVKQKLIIVKSSKMAEVLI